jgi:hypothetical protein
MCTEGDVSIGTIPQATLNQSRLVYVREKMSLQTVKIMKRSPKSINNRKNAYFINVCFTKA